MIKNLFAFIGIYRTIQIIWQQYELKKDKKITIRGIDTVIALVLSGCILYILNLM